VTNKYNLRGVSASKEDIYRAIEDLDKGIYPQAFCKILPDIVGGEPDHCNIMHADTAGTKTSLAYIYWKETGDISVWKGIVQDAIVMNLDDLICVGATDNIIFSSTIGRNKKLIPAEVIAAIIQSTADFMDKFKKYGINLYLAGGETADVGDIVRTIDVGITAFTRLQKKQLIINDIKSGDLIVGLASYGQATYEEVYNSGIGCNGLTSARHDIFHKTLAQKYPESYDKQIPEQMVYSGAMQLIDKIEDVPPPAGGEYFNAGQLILSPTRTYAPVIKEILKHHHSDIDGIIHCSGGGQTKILHYVDDLHIIKNNLLPVPPVFKLIQEQSKTDWNVMYQVFNMGHRMEIYCQKEAAQAIIQISEKFNIEAQVIGECQQAKNKLLTIDSPYGKFEYLL